MPDAKAHFRVPVFFPFVPKHHRSDLPIPLFPYHKNKDFKTNFMKLFPAFHYIFFVLELLSFELRFVKKNKKGCRCNRGYRICRKWKYLSSIQDLSIFQKYNQNRTDNHNYRTNNLFLNSFFLKKLVTKYNTYNC